MSIENIYILVQGWVIDALGLLFQNLEFGIQDLGCDLSFKKRLPVKIYSRQTSKKYLKIEFHIKL